MLTQRVIGSVQQEGTCWAGRGRNGTARPAMRISVCNWSTTEERHRPIRGRDPRCVGRRENERIRMSVDQGLALPVRLVLVDPPAGVDFGIQTRPWFSVRNGVRAAAFTRRHRLRLFDNGRGRRKKWLAGLPGAIRSRTACRQIRLRWRRDIRRPERQLLVAPDEDAAPGNHVAIGSPGDESIWRQAPGENSWNRQGRRPKLRDRQTARRVARNRRFLTSEATSSLTCTSDFRSAK